MSTIEFAMMSHECLRRCGKSKVKIVIIEKDRKRKKEKEGLRASERTVPAATKTSS